MFQAHKEREFEVDLPVATAANIASGEDNCSFLDYKLRSPDTPIDRAVMSIPLNRATFNSTDLLGSH